MKTTRLSNPATVRAHATAVTLAAAALALAGCVGVLGPTPPATGTPRDAVLQSWGPPTGRYALPAGGERLEYASGPYGRTTWMVDIDAGGRVQAASQVLNEMNFQDFALRVPGMTPAQVMFELGRPGEMQRLGWMNRTLWSWRYPTTNCLLFQVDFEADGRAKSAGYNIDRRCDPPTVRP